jgi:hypothetical protein
MVDKNETHAQENNVIAFPKEKRFNQVAESNLIQLPVAPRLDSKNYRREWLIGTLAGVFALALFINSSGEPILNKTDRQSRSLASVSPFATQLRDVQLEKKVASQLTSKMRKPASLGELPSQADEFKYGFLESKYAVKFYQGKIQELAFADSASVDVEPRYLSNRSQFLRDYKDLFPINFSSTQNLNREVVDKKILETYELIDGDQAKVGQVHFELDIHGRLLGMKVTSIR